MWQYTISESWGHSNKYWWPPFFDLQGHISRIQYHNTVWFSGFWFKKMAVNRVVDIWGDSPLPYLKCPPHIKGLTFHLGPKTMEMSEGKNITPHYAFLRFQWEIPHQINAFTVNDPFWLLVLRKCLSIPDHFIEVYLTKRVQRLYLNAIYVFFFVI